MNDHDTTTASSTGRRQAVDARFPKSARLRKRRQYLQVQGRGTRVHGELLVLVAARGRGARPRLGITASKKVGDAVQRNRAKRLLRESFRRHQAQWPAGLDLVVIARAALASATLDAVDRDLQQVVQRAVSQLQGRRRSRSAPPRPGGEGS